MILIDWTLLQCLQVVINAFWLFPLRVCLALPSFLAICIFGIVVILEKTKNKGHLLDGGGKFVLHVAERHDVNDYVDNGVPKQVQIVYSKHRWKKQEYIHCCIDS